MLDVLMAGYLKTINESVTKQIRKELSDPTNAASIVRLGTVADAAGRPKVRFDGEDGATDRRYPYAASYTPALNDRVLLIRSGSTWVILCKVV